MKRLYFRNTKNMKKVAEELGFQLDSETKEIEISIENNEYSVWENYNGIAHPVDDGVDEVGLIAEFEEMADEVECEAKE